MAIKNVPPSIRETAFNCPHCGTFTTQYWLKLYSLKLDKDNPTPDFPSQEWADNLKRDKEIEEEGRNWLLSWYEEIHSGMVFLDKKASSKYPYLVNNLYLTECYNCHKFAVWVYDRLLFPPEKSGDQPNPDIPENVLKDFEEARSILDLSPRGAAALLRLAIQKLCVHLGENGKKIDDDIAILVSKGLSPLVQQSLDIVRVIGNEAVHPGVIDLNDDRDTAEKLFGLINVIAEQMISIPKHVKEMYEGLPEDKRKAIETRDSKTKGC